jgi:hypothetical protein
MRSFQQITLRLPQDLAQRLAAHTPPRKRNQFVVDLVRVELDRESRELQEAAMRLSSLELGQVVDDSQWLALDGDAAWGEFDEKRFLEELDAQSGRRVKAQSLKRQPK